MYSAKTIKIDWVEFEMFELLNREKGCHLFFVKIK